MRMGLLFALVTAVVLVVTPAPNAHTGGSFRTTMEIEDALEISQWGARRHVSLAQCRGTGLMRKRGYFEKTFRHFDCKVWRDYPHKNLFVRVHTVGKAKIYIVIR